MFFVHGGAAIVRHHVETAPSGTGLYLEQKRLRTKEPEGPQSHQHFFSSYGDRIS